MVPPVSPAVKPMTEQERLDALLDAIVTMEAAVIEAHAKFAKVAIELREREMATCAMANAIMLIEHMDEQGRCAEAIPAIMQILPKLAADGIKDAVFGRIRRLRGGLN